MKKEKKASVVGSLSVMTVMTADRYFNVRISHNTKRDLVTCDPREDPMCLVFFYRCLSLPNFSGHKRTLVSIRSVAPSSQNKLRHALHTVQPFKKPCSKITSHRGARTCRVHDLAVFKGRSKWPSLKKKWKNCWQCVITRQDLFIHSFSKGCTAGTIPRN